MLGPWPFLFQAPKQSVTVTVSSADGMDFLWQCHKGMGQWKQTWKTAECSTPGISNIKSISGWCCFSIYLTLPKPPKIPQNWQALYLPWHRSKNIYKAKIEPCHRQKKNQPPFHIYFEEKYEENVLNRELGLCGRGGKRRGAASRRLNPFCLAFGWVDPPRLAFWEKDDPPCCSRSSICHWGQRNLSSWVNKWSPNK